jgi:hypothetical protein
MAQPHELRSFDYVNHSYADVAAALRARGNEIFARATAGATDRAKQLATTLRVHIAGLEVGAPISLDITHVEEEPTETSAGPILHMKLEWSAARNPTWFPVMEATLDAYALAHDETQLDFHGHYRAPFGVLGQMVDAVVGHRVAEASVHRFVQDVARFLRDELGKRKAAGQSVTASS